MGFAAAKSFVQKGDVTAVGGEGGEEVVAKISAGDLQRFVDADLLDIDMGAVTALAAIPFESDLVAIG